ncbi:MAG: hypothetical protein JW839_05775 [Candidatus Lokiarchaeota archaeon]|nr:hypothetical protein [Candidatus Lokiarchaeota archaeon]
MAFEWLMQVFWGFFVGGVTVTVILMVLLGMSMSHSSGSEASEQDAGDEGIDGQDADVGDADAGDADVDAGDVDVDAGDVDVDAGDVDVDAGDADVDAGDVDVDAGAADVDAGDAGETDLEDADAGDSDLDDADAGGSTDLDVSAGMDSPDAVLFASDKGQKAPLMLLIAGYLMFSGALGLTFSNLLETNVLVVVGIAFVPPFLLNKLLGKIWRRVTRSETYIIPAGLPLIGRKVRVYMKVDIDGGVVRLDAPGTPIGSQRVPVMPLYSDKVFDSGKEVYICDYGPVQGKKYYLVDDDPGEVRKARQINV